MNTPAPVNTRHPPFSRHQDMNTPCSPQDLAPSLTYPALRPLCQPTHTPSAWYHRQPPSTLKSAKYRSTRLVYEPRNCQAIAASLRGSYAPRTSHLPPATPPHSHPTLPPHTTTDLDAPGKYTVAEGTDRHRRHKYRQGSVQGFLRCEHTMCEHTR